MTVCSMCGNQFTPADKSDLRYIAEDKLICEACSHHLDTILDSDDQHEIQKACSAVYNHYIQIPDPVVRYSVKKFMINNAPPAFTKVFPNPVEPKKEPEPAVASAPSEGGMFGNVSSSIKLLTKVFCWVGIIVSVICSIMLFAANNPPHQSTSAAGLLCLILGPFFSWAFSLFLYAFADLLDETKKNNQLLTELVKHSKPDHNSKK